MTDNRISRKRSRGPVALHELFPPDHRIPEEKRVYVNRNLRMPTIGSIGFDLDHTLAHYDPLPVEELAFKTTQQKLVEHRGYPKAIARIKYDPEFVIRGLVIDKKAGNILKMNYHSYVTRAFHGRRELGKAILKLYRSDRISLSDPRYVSVDTLFHLPEVYLFLSIIDFLEESGQKDLDFEKIYQDVREMIDQAHADGSLKDVIMAKPGRFIKRDPQLPVLLDHFRSWGKKIFLLTNSEYFYADVLLSHLLHTRRGDNFRHWSDYFDVVICEARKPRFFEPRNAKDTEPWQRIPELEHPAAYHGGRASDLEAAVGYSSDKVIYFGDHTYGDILIAKKNCGWRTAMIVEELEDEQRISRSLEPKLRIVSGLNEERQRIDLERAALEREVARLAHLNGQGAPAAKKKRNEQIEYLTRELKARSESVAELDREIGKLWRETQRRYNRVWGPLFREGNETSRFGHQVKDFACLYTSTVTNFLQYPSDHYFRTQMDRMAHEIS